MSKFVVNRTLFRESGDIFDAETLASILEELECSVEDLGFLMPLDDDQDGEYYFISEYLRGYIFNVYNCIKDNLKHDWQKIRFYGQSVALSYRNAGPIMMITSTKYATEIL